MKSKTRNLEILLSSLAFEKFGIDTLLIIDKQKKVGGGSAEYKRNVLLLRVNVKHLSDALQLLKQGSHLDYELINDLSDDTFEKLEKLGTDIHPVFQTLQETAADKVHHEMCDLIGLSMTDFINKFSFFRVFIKINKI